MALSIIQQRYGGPEVLQAQEVDLAPPGAGEVRLRHGAIGVNFHDIYVREGTTRTLTPPAIPGIEAVGAVVAVGDAVEGWSVGDRAAYVSRGYGAYCAERNITADLLLRPPAQLSDETVASSLMRGITAAVLLTELHRVEAGCSVLIHAASGITGRRLCAWARRIGARVIGSVTTPARKAEVAGLYDAVVLNRDADWPEQVRALTGGGADHVLDSIGAPTFAGSLDAAAPCGHVSLYGQVGGPVESVPIAALARKSLSMSRPIVFDWYRSGTVGEMLARRFYAQVEGGVIELQPPLVMDLQEAGRAQTLLQNRGADRPIVLKP